LLGTRSGDDQAMAGRLGERICTEHLASFLTEPVPDCGSPSADSFI
jgi:hypothetical protein